MGFEWVAFNGNSVYFYELGLFFCNPRSYLVWRILKGMNREHTTELFIKTKVQVAQLSQTIKQLEIQFKENQNTDLVEDNISEIHDTLINLNYFLNLECN